MDDGVALPPTTKDIARAAGVSRATVDRVLNGREGVRPGTVERVEAAVRDLGFVRNIAAANLAKGRGYRFLFVLPRTGDAFLAELTRLIGETTAAFAAERMGADLHRVDTNDPHALAAHLAALPDGRWDGVAIMAPRSPQLRDAVLRLEARGIGVLPFVSGLRLGAEAVGIDDRAAGATAGLLMGRFAGPRPGKVLVVAETMKAQDSLDRRHGFDRLLTQRFTHLAALPSVETYGAAVRTRAVLEAATRAHAGLRGIYILASEARVPLETLRALGLPTDVTVIAHERTAATVAALRDGALDAAITQDAGHLVRSALRRLKARRDRAAILPAQERIRTEILLATNV